MITVPGQYNGPYHWKYDTAMLSAMTMYKDFFARLKLPITLVYYCSYCNNYFGTEKTEVCNICKKSDLRSLISSPVEQQLESILASKYLHSIHSEELLQLISFLFFFVMVGGGGGGGETWDCAKLFCKYGIKLKLLTVGVHSCIVLVVLLVANNYTKIEEEMVIFSICLILKCQLPPINTHQGTSMVIKRFLAFFLINSCQFYD